jgi:hypothetical protein
MEDDIFGAHCARISIACSMNQSQRDLRRPPFVRRPGGGIKLGSVSVKPPVSLVAAFSVFSRELWKDA